MTQLNDRPQYAPGDKVRITIDATVHFHSATGRLLYEYVAVPHDDPEEVVYTRDVIDPGSPAVTVHSTDMDAKPIAVLGFPLRISNILRRNRICTVGELVARKPEDLRDLTGFGDVALAEVMATLGEQDPPLELQPTDIPLRAETVRVMAEIGDKS